MKDKTIYQMCICTLRYAQNRDNHLAPATAIENIKEALQSMKDRTIKIDTMKQIIDEINRDIAMYKREYKALWLDFANELSYDLTNYSRYGVL